MKIVPVTQQACYVRHWGKWWVVQRAGEDWRRLPIGKKYVKPKSLKQISADLQKKYPSKPMPTILDEKFADQEVEKNRKKHAEQKKKAGNKSLPKKAT